MTNFLKLKQNTLYAATYALRNEIENLRDKRMELLTQAANNKKLGKNPWISGGLKSLAANCTLSELGCFRALDILSKIIEKEKRKVKHEGHQNQ